MDIPYVVSLGQRSIWTDTLATMDYKMFKCTGKTDTGYILSSEVIYLGFVDIMFVDKM